MKSNNYCFVIQPFDNGGKFDKRYSDIYEPAIKSAGLNAYRIDKDPSVRNIVDDIENKIQNSQICLADISIDNPNVWYELGYAYASGKDVVMVCDDSRSKYPFDIQHRSIIPFKSDAPSDFEELSKKITEKIKSYLSTKKTREEIITTPLNETDGFKSFEMTMIALLIGWQIIDEESVSVYNLKEQMKQVGYKEAATSIGLKLLNRKGVIEMFYENDRYGNDIPVCRLTEKGINFVLDNVDKFNLGTASKESLIKTTNETDDDLPF
jgi:hypothetical protein